MFPSGAPCFESPVNSVHVQMCCLRDFTRPHMIGHNGKELLFLYRNMAAISRSHGEGRGGGGRM